MLYVTDLMRVLVSCYTGLHVGHQTLVVCNVKLPFRLQYYKTEVNKDPLVFLFVESAVVRFIHRQLQMNKI